jgi:hypothetical protein
MTMRNGWSARAGWTLAVLGLTALTGCGAPGEDGASLGNMVLFAGTTVPPARPAEIEDVYCPPITVAAGGSSLQAGGGQIVIGQMARECVGQPDGSTLVKIGVEGRALMSSGGSGRYSAPIHMVVKNGSTVLANRSRAVGVAIPAGDTQGSFSIVEDGIVVPPSAVNSFEIEVGLGGRARRG